MSKLLFTYNNSIFFKTLSAVSKADHVKDVNEIFGGVGNGGVKNHLKVTIMLMIYEIKITKFYITCFLYFFTTKVH